MDNNGEEILQQLAQNLLLLKYNSSGESSAELTSQLASKMVQVRKYIQLIARGRKPNTSTNAGMIKDALVTKVSKIHKSPLKGLLLSNLIDRLNRDNGVQNPGPYLYLLSRLNQHQFNYNINESTNNPTSSHIEEDNTWFHSSGLPPIDNRSQAVNTSNNQSLASNQSEEQIAQSPNSNLNISQGFTQSLDPEFVDERTLIKDMIYIFQGVDGVYLKFDSENNLSAIDQNVKIHPAHLSMIKQLFELGSLFKHIQNFVNIQLTEGDSGLIVQSFCAALQSCIAEYFRLLAILDAKVSDQVQNTLTFRNLFLWTREPLKRFQLMYHMTDVCYHLHGGALISALYSLTNHGDPFVQNFCLEILNKASKPFHDMIQYWVDEGELHDPFDEFFVQRTYRDPSGNPWTSKYFIHVSMAPAYCEKELLKKIFAIGRSLDFIRSTCKNPDWHWKNLQEGLSLQFSSLIKLTKSVDLVHSLASRELLNILFHQQHLLVHLNAMKKYLLLGQGDFVRHLMDLIHDELDKPCQMIHTHHLSRILDSAIRGSNAQFDKPEIINKIQVKMTINPGDKSGWDCFSLTYLPSPPINAVISTDSLTIYSDLFRTLWRVKRMEVALSQGWLTHASSLAWLKSLPDIQSDLSHCGTLMSEMIHFINQYQYFIQCEILEPNWTELIDFIEHKANDLDQVITEHQNILQKIQSQIGLYDYDPMKVLLILSKIFESIMSFKRVHEKFIQTSLAMVQSNSKKGYNRVLSDFEVDPLLVNNPDNQRTIERLKIQLDSISNDFRENVKIFLKHLYQKDEQGTMSLRFRLDYNEFYTGLFATSEPSSSSRRSSRASHRHSWLIQ